MKTKLLIGVAVAVMGWTMPAAAQMPVYGYATKENRCPAGLQPVVVGGVICCGTPNQSMSYQAANAHPVMRKAKKRSLRKVASTYCPEGMKGCVER